MTLSLAQHEDACIPFKRCRACNAADIISNSRSKEVVAMFATDTDSSPFEPGVHIPGCTPINPCANCRSVALLRNELGDREFNKLMELLNGSKPPETVHHDRDPSYLRLKKALMRPVSELEASVRTENIFRNEMITCVGDICKITEDDFLRKPNVGRKTVQEIKELLAPMELSFGMEITPDMFPVT